MKNCLLIFIFLVASTAGAMAQSMLKVRLADNSVINVAVDGRYFNKKGTSVTVGDLPPGRHKLTIYTVQQTRYGRGHEDVVYSGKIFTHDGNITLFTYDTYNDQTDVQEQDINSYSQTTQLPHNGAGTYENNSSPQVNNNNRDYDNDNRYIQSPGHKILKVNATLTDVKIDQLKIRITDKKADLEKTNLLKDGLKGETMTTDQISAMMDWFNFEDSKEDFAKWAYPNTVDKENFTSLESKLTYQNYVDDLDKFIKSNNR